MMLKMIIHVEDDPSQRDLLAAFLGTELGFMVVSCGDGQEAIEKLEHIRPDLIVTDIRMPRMDGFELCSKVKADPRTREIPVLMLTRYSDPDTVMRALACGADNFIEKPYDLNLLLLRVRELTEPGPAAAVGDLSVTIGESHFKVSASPQQMLNFFRSAYEAAINARQGLVRANQFLEQRVADRTLELQHQTEEVQKSYAELEQVNYLVSHHLQNPLQKMLGFFGMVERACQGKVTSSTDRALGEVSEGILKLQTLVNDLLLYSEKDSADLPVVEADLGELLQEVITNDLIKEIQLLDAEIHADTLPRMRINPWQIKQVLFNLLQNSLKFHGPKRPVIHVSSKELDGEWKISVSDNGVGISESYFESIFYISPRVHSSVSFLGTGVGLAICRKIVERHRGRIWVESTEGVGSTFYFTISKSLGNTIRRPPDTGDDRRDSSAA